MPKISQLEAATDITASDLMQVVDIEDTGMAPSGTNKKATAQLVANNLAKIVNNGAVITANTSTDAVRITQTGSGNALVVEDSANPDSTPLVVNDLGDILIGQTQSITGTFAFNRGVQTANIAGVQLGNYDNTAFGESITFNKSRGTVSSPHVAPADGDDIGLLVFAGSDGTKFISGAEIRSEIDGTPGVDDMPGRLAFLTTADGAAVPTERMRITSAGNVGIGTSTPTAKLNVVDSSSQDALRITQTGSGNALVVEDSANPDADPIVISNEGRMYVGYTQNIVTPVGSPKLQVQTGASFIRHSSSFAPRIDLARSDSDTIGTHVAVVNEDGIGEIGFCGSDGTNYITGATISSNVDGTPGANDMPGRLSFSTRADGAAALTERMRITSDGNVGIGTSSPSSKLHISGDLTMSSATTATSATAGTNGDVPAQVVGYLVVNINGTARKIPYYA